MSTKPNIGTGPLDPSISIQFRAQRLRFSPKAAAMFDESKDAIEALCRNGMLPWSTPVRAALRRQVLKYVKLKNPTR